MLSCRRHHTICSFTVFPSSSIVRIFYAFVSLLPATYVHGTSSAYKVDTNSGDVALSIRIIREPQQQARLSHTRVSDQEQLEEIIISEFILCQRPWANVQPLGSKRPGGWLWHVGSSTTTWRWVLLWIWRHKGGLSKCWRMWSVITLQERMLLVYMSHDANDVCQLVSSEDFAHEVQLTTLDSLLRRQSLTCAALPITIFSWWR